MKIEIPLILAFLIGLGVWLSSSTPTCYLPPSPNPYVWKSTLTQRSLERVELYQRYHRSFRHRKNKISGCEYSGEREEGYKEAKEFVKNMIHGKRVYLDRDDICGTGKYGRIIAVVYAPYGDNCFVNLNQLLLKEGYAEISDYYNEFDPFLIDRLTNRHRSF